MKARDFHSTKQYFVWLALLAAAFFVIGIFNMPQRLAVSSPEVTFTDASANGLAIMPASCSSNPSYYHSGLTVQGAGYSIAPGQSEYGAYKNGVYICVSSNTSGNTYFIPANTAAEMNSFKTYKPPGVTVY